MYNQVKDRFRLVQTEIVRAIPVFGRTLSAMEGYSLEVFRGKIHRGSVRTRDDESTSNTEREYVKMKVYNRDVIYKINILPQLIPVVGSLTTKDKYILVYDVTIDLVVSDPFLFVQEYRLGRDPEDTAIGRFKTSLQNYASHTEHDKLSSLKQLGDAWNNTVCAATGMKITQISRWKDPKSEEAIKFQQEAENKRKLITTQAEIQKLEDRLERERDALKREHARGEHRKQNEFEREEETQQHMHKLHMTLRDTAAEELTAILRERIRDTFETGKQVDEVAEDSLKLLNAFHEGLQRGRVVDSTLSSGSNTSTNSTSSEEATTIKGNAETDPLLHIPSNLADLSRKREKETEEQ